MDDHTVTYLSCVENDIEANSIVSRLTDVPLALEHELISDEHSCSGTSSSSASLVYQPKYSLRARSIQRRIEVEVKQTEPKTRHSKPKSRPAPLSKYRRKSANAKERSRMRDINSAFEMLERSIPELAGRHPRTEKVTKITVLRLAINYINNLSTLLEGGPGDMASYAGSVSDFTDSSPSSVSSCTTPTPSLNMMDLPLSSVSSSMMTMTSAVAVDALDEIEELTDFQLPHELVVFLNSANPTQPSSTPPTSASTTAASVGYAAATNFPAMAEVQQAGGCHTTYCDFGELPA